jgi:hypothetical protein
MSASESPCAKSTGRLIIWLFILYVLDLRNSSLRQERREFLRVIKLTGQPSYQPDFRIIHALLLP